MARDKCYLFHWGITGFKLFWQQFAVSFVVWQRCCGRPSSTYSRTSYTTFEFYWCVLLYFPQVSAWRNRIWAHRRQIPVRYAAFNWAPMNWKHIFWPNWIVCINWAPDRSANGFVPVLIWIRPCIPIMEWCRDQIAAGRCVLYICLRLVPAPALASVTISSSK